MKIELQGIGVSKGTAKGPVFLLDEKTSLSSFKTGSVLVTKMTNPFLMPIMLKAVAIVTDKGGMLCHAATVSRELGIPCVVGTEKATSVLKNGLKIIVDGNKGQVNEI
jgi:pyruvate, water dikinase